MSDVIHLDTDTFLLDLARIMSATMASDSVYQTALNEVDESFERIQIAASEKAKLRVNFIQNCAIAFTQTAAQCAVELQKTKSSFELTAAEIEFNKARTKLVEAQTLTEASKKLEIERQTRSYDDQLRVKEAEALKDAVFGYASGGVTVPSNLQSTMLTAIDNITNS